MKVVYFWREGGVTELKVTRETRKRYYVEVPGDLKWWDSPISAFYKNPYVSKDDHRVFSSIDECLSSRESILIARLDAAKKDIAEMEKELHLLYRLGEAG